MGKNKKVKFYGIIALVALLILIGGATYAYFTDSVAEPKNVDVEVITQTNDALMFTKGSNITITASIENFNEESGSLLGATWAKATYQKGSDENSTGSGHYYLYFEVNENTFKYTQEANKTTNKKPAELILQVSNDIENDNIVLKDLEGNNLNLTYVENLTVKVLDKEATELAKQADENAAEVYVTKTVSGYDITEYLGVIVIANNHEITSNSSTTLTEHTWNFDVVMVNLDADQAENYGAKLNGTLYIQSEAKNFNLTLAQYIIDTLYTTDGANGLYYHDGKGTYTNADQEAGDNSYRFAGSNSVVTKNYVCFGAEVNASGACDTNHLYRIIGVFNKYFQDSSKEPEYQVKLIKSTFATTTEIGTGQNSGTNTFYWQGTNSSSYNNTWSQSTLNTTALNNYYYNTYLDGSNNSKWSRMIDTHTWKVGGNTWDNIGTQTVKTAYTNEILNPVTTNSKDSKTELDNKIGLMYVSDYMYAALPTYWTYVGYTDANYKTSAGNYGEEYDYRAAINDNWLYLGGTSEWTISRRANDARLAFYVDSNGRVHGNYVYDAFGVRPVFYLESSVLYDGGNGEAGTPFIVELG